MRKSRYKPERRRVVEDEVINHHEIKKDRDSLAAGPVSTWKSSLVVSTLKGDTRQGGSV
jgi:hypothetical protein